MNTSEWIESKNKSPNEPGKYEIKYEIWRYHSLIEKGEDIAGHDGSGGSRGWDMTDGEEYGEEYRSITHWRPIP